MSVFTTGREPKLAGTLERLAKLHPRKIDLSLERMRRCLAALGHPEKKLPPVIHVAGTNGKGSVVAYLRAIFEASGHRVHVYTSPHLVSFRERIRLAGSLISEDFLISVLEGVEKANGNNPITYFEITTAAAFLAFSETPADVCLLEVGLGGRLDATNVVENPLVSIVTPVALDHAEFLGTDLKGIAREKAGIFKKDALAVASPQTPEVAGVLQEEAEKAGARLTFADKNLVLPKPALEGAHQMENARTTVTALMAQSIFSFSPDSIAKGLRDAFWPARFQTLDSRGFGLDEASDVWLDGGHNPHAGAALAGILRGMENDPRPLIAVVGMMANKDIGGFLKPLKPYAKRLIAVPIPGEDGAADPESVAAVANDCGIGATAARSFDAALADIAKVGPVRVLICGSLYLAGFVLDKTGNNPE